MNDMATGQARADSASITGSDLIRLGSDRLGGFQFSTELWDWFYQTCPAFAGKPVRITIEAQEPTEGGDEHA